MLHRTICAVKITRRSAILFSQGDVDASGGGEGLAEPIEDADLEVAAVAAAAAAPVPAVVEKLNDSIAEVETQLAEAAEPVAEKVDAAVEEVAAAVAELKASTPPPVLPPALPVAAVHKHVEQDEDGELKVTSQIAAAVKQPLTNGLVELNGSAELNGNAEHNGKPEL